MDVQNAAPYVPLLGEGQACRAFVCAFLLSLGFHRTHQTPWHGGGGLTRHAPDVRSRLGGVPIWRLQGTTCQAVCTGLPHGVWRYRPRRPDVARDARLATHGGLSLALCAGLYPLAPMALSCLIWACGPPSLVPGLTRGG